MAVVGLMIFGMESCIKDKINDDYSITVTKGEWVDLDLPSGLLWYSVNLGSTTTEGFGSHYAWGETQPKREYTWTTYTYGDYHDPTYNIYKYNTEEKYGTVDNKTTIEASDDAATIVIGSGARIPTEAEWQELINNTTSQWDTTINGVCGQKLTSKKNGCSIFLPAAGYCSGILLCHVGKYGGYWSASLCDKYPSYAYGVYFSSDSLYVGSGGYRDFGRSIRAVRSAQ